MNIPQLKKDLSPYSTNEIPHLDILPVCDYNRRAQITSMELIGTRPPLS